MLGKLLCDVMYDVLLQLEHCVLYVLCGEVEQLHELCLMDHVLHEQPGVTHAGHEK